MKRWKAFDRMLIRLFDKSNGWSLSVLIPITVFIVLAVKAFIFLNIKKISLFSKDGLDGKFVLVSLLISLTIFAGYILLKYLQNNGDSDDSYGERTMMHQLIMLRYEFLNFKKKAGILDDSASIDGFVKGVIEERLTNEFIQERIEQSFSKSAIKNRREDELVLEFNKTSSRINEELNRLRRSANLNLVIGTLATAIAICALTYEVFLSSIRFDDMVGILSHYIPRVLLVIFIEVFAFFFLRLYKANLAEIKYFNNEKTNIDFKLISLKTALSQAEPSMISQCLTELIKTERNFILKKDESTVELEKMKSEQDNKHVLVNLLEKIVAKK